MVLHEASNSCHGRLGGAAGSALFRLTPGLPDLLHAQREATEEAILLRRTALLLGRLCSPRGSERCAECLDIRARTSVSFSEQGQALHNMRALHGDGL